MNILENKDYRVTVEDGVIKGFFSKLDPDGKNLADSDGVLGSVCYTLKDDDITKAAVPFAPYKSRISRGEAVKVDENSIELFDTDMGISSRFALSCGLFLEASAKNPEISEFGINLDLNFIEKSGDYRYQLLPTSPNDTDDGSLHFCIMTRPHGGYLLCAAVGDCVGWKIDYSSHAYGHFILNFKFLASFDKAYAPESSESKRLGVWLFAEKELDEVYKRLSFVYGVPYVRLVLGGSFIGKPTVEVSPDTDRLVVTSPMGKVSELRPCGKTVFIPTEEFGFYTVTPYSADVCGIGGRVWYSADANRLFTKSCEAMRPPYHPDDNLAEGGCFIWAWLLNMRLSGHLAFDEKARRELSEIMGQDGIRTKRKTIVPYKTEKYDAYHIEGSDRIQEQFFGVSILTEAYKLYGDKKYLEFAIEALSELQRNWITPEGKIYNGVDYTTVCAPVIPIVDLAILLNNIGDRRGEHFCELALKIAEYLLGRGISFPTEGDAEKFEDGSVSCTALSLLYVYHHIKRDGRFLRFAGEVLKLHEAWTVYSSDVRMNGSSFRWWETIWEGDGEGPAICAGHAWTAWKTEALYLYALAAHDEAALLASYNGYMSTLVKTQSDGSMYACFEPDYIRGGGDADVKRDLKQLAGEDRGVKYKLAHSYPEHKDNSLSRYAWIRYAYSWLGTAAVIKKDGEMIALNARLDGDTLILAPEIKTLFLGDGVGNIKLSGANNVRMLQKGMVN